MLLRIGSAFGALSLFPYLALAEPVYLECLAETDFSISKGKRASDTRYIFSYDSDTERLVKVQHGDRPIAIFVEYECRSDALQIYCERYDYGTYWTFQLTKKDASFIESIGEYTAESIGVPTSNKQGFCKKYDPPEDALQLD